MQLLPGQALPRRRVDRSYPHLLRKISSESALLAAAIALACIAISDRTVGAQGPPRDGGPAPPDMSSFSREIEVRSPVLHDHSLRLNLNAFNQERKKAIAKDSEKLLALALALKTELERDPNNQSEDLIQKVKEIEKLAHKVKQRMLADPTPSSLLR